MVQAYYDNHRSSLSVSLRTFLKLRAMSSCNWVPLQLPLGTLPDEGTKEFEVSGGDIDLTKSKQILVYAFVSLHDLEDSEFQRGYYEIFTKDTKGTEYKFFLNVAFGGKAGDTAINSGNFWLPYGPGFQPGVFVRLVGATAKRKKPSKSVAAGKNVGEVLEEFHKQTEPEAIYSFMFITGHQS